MISKTARGLTPEVDTVTITKKGTALLTTTETGARALMGAETGARALSTKELGAKAHMRKNMTAATKRNQLLCHSVMNAKPSDH